VHELETCKERERNRDGSMFERERERDGEKERKSVKEIQGE